MTLDLSIKTDQRVSLGKHKRAKMAELKLHGFWFSPFVMRVEWTLKLKGIPYEYIEEDHYNKSPQLVQYNPVHKKVPVLVHAGKPICESVIIVEYIDEIWPQNPLVPSDPYERALARFWVKYADDMVPAVVALFRSSSEGREKAVEKLWEYFRVVEDQCLIDSKILFGGDAINIVDLGYGSIFNYLEVLEDMFDVKVLVAEKFPRLHSWYKHFNNAPVISENLPNKEKMLATLKSFREKILAST